MKVRTDWCLYKGSSHEICEDYIIATPIRRQHLVLCDGCSSSPNTDVGARLLAHTISGFIDDFINFNNPQTLLADIVRADYMDKIIKCMSLDPTCLDATALFMFYFWDQVQIFMCGDGFLIHHSPEHLQTLIREKSHPDGAPYYPNYLGNTDRQKEYFNTFSAMYDIHDEVVINIHDSMEAGGVGNYQKPVTDFLPTVISPNVGDVILLISDGLKSFVNKTTGEHLNPYELVPDLLGFKNMNGSFLKRRVKRFLKELEAEGISHYDDLSIGAMYFDKA